MAAEIKSGASADLLAVDPASKAARVTLYDSTGNPIYAEYSGSYMVPFEAIPSTLTDGTTYFAMRNLGSKRIFLHAIRIKAGYSGTAAASRSLLRFERFSGATPTGGTALAAVKKDNTFAASSVTDVRYAAGGLTTTGVTFEQRFATLGVTNQLNVDTASIMEYGDHLKDRLVLGVNEGLAIRAYGAVIAGCWFIGEIHWDEMT